jgi:alkane 1-monooxygenase
MQENKYIDKKKYLWLLSSILPVVSLLGVYLYQSNLNTWSLFIPLITIYIFIPLLDLLLKLDASNPPESIVPELENKKYYSFATYLMLPIHFYCLYYLIQFILVADLTIWQNAIIIFTLGVFGGLAVNLGHELGHKKGWLDKNLAKLALASAGYGHFNIEHNAGHHREVATPEDSASSKFGENIYQFALREIPGGVKRAWKIETQRLNKKNKSWLSLDNQILHSYFLTISICVLFSYFLGWQSLIILLLHAPIVWWQLTSANYIEHYGLLRAKNENGQYVRCEPKHSWNSNHIVSNLVLFHLQRHSDHHAHPARHYQSLRHFEQAPQLPAGYMGMFVLAYFPPLWRKIMDPKVLNLANNDFAHINHL